MNYKEKSLEVFWNINFLWLNLLMEKEFWKKNIFLEKSLLNTKKTILESNFSEELKKELSSFLNFESINEKNFKRILQIFEEYWWNEKYFSYDEKRLKENFEKNMIKIFFEIWEKMFEEIEKEV